MDYDNRCKLLRRVLEGYTPEQLYNKLQSYPKCDKQLPILKENKIMTTLTISSKLTQTTIIVDIKSQKSVDLGIGFMLDHAEIAKEDDTLVLMEHLCMNEQLTNLEVLNEMLKLDFVGENMDISLTSNTVRS